VRASHRIQRRYTRPYGTLALLSNIKARCAGTHLRGPAMAAIIVQALHKQYGDPGGRRPVLHRRGRRGAGLLGPNGAGKTTTVEVTAVGRRGGGDARPTDGKA
jgi:hypothetical protein